MKKIVSFALALVTVLSCACVFTISGSAASPIVFEAGEIAGTDYRITSVAATVDGMQVLKSVPKNEANVPKIDRHRLNAPAADYKYVKIIFKTNHNLYPMVFDFQKGSGDFAAKKYQFIPKAANCWVGAIFELDASLASSGKSYGQLHLWPWGNVNGDVLSGVGAEICIQSWGFFATLDEAKAYNKDKYTVEQLPGDNDAVQTVLEASNQDASNAEIVKADPIVFSGGKVMTKAYRLTGEEVEIDGVAALKLVANEESAVPKIDNWSLNASTGNYAYLKLIYKTNWNDGNVVVQFIGNSAKGNASGKYSYCPPETGKWTGTIIQLAPDAVGSNMKYAQMHLSPWGDNSGILCKELGVETYFESIGFFSTLEEAKAYNKELCEVEQIIEYNGQTSGVSNVPVIKPSNLEPNRDGGVYGFSKAGAASGEPIVIDASVIMQGGFSDPEKNISYPASAGDEGSARIVFAKETSVGKMQFNPASLVGSEVDKTRYNYFKVKYKYNLTNPSGNYKMMLREGYSGASTNHFLFEIPKDKNGEWIEQSCAISWGTSKEPSAFTLHPVREGDKVSAGDYFDFAYIAFFTSGEQAKSFTLDTVSHESASSSVHKAYMTGYSDGTFKPNKTMTRAEACTVVARLLDTEENIAAGTATTFTDVSASKWYAKYVSFCESKGLLKSYSGTFLPEQNITRAEFAELVYNTGLAKEDPANRKTFSDVPQMHPRYTAIMAAASAGLVGGYDDGTFLPDRTITRAQVVTVINRALGRVINEFTIPHGYEMTAFTDVPASFWAYNAIAEATTAHEIYTDTLAQKFDGEIWLAKVNTGDAAKAKLAEVDALAEKRKQEILNTADELTVSGTKYYLSANGDNNNSGTDPAKPRKTLPSGLKSGDGVFFKRGDTFRMYLSCTDGVSYGAYGEGPKPRILGSPKNYAESEWTLVEGTTNIYVCGEMLSSDCGLIVYNDGEKWADKYWTSSSEKLSVDKLTKNDMFIHDPADMKVYVRCDEGNPSSVYKQIDFNLRQNIVSGAPGGLVLDNLCFMYTGAHGVGGARENCTISNCVFGFIGGSLQNEEARYGNAIEFWGPSINCQVVNTYVYQVYDAGLTFQMKGNGVKDVAEGFDGILLDNNLVENCAYNIEYFTRDYKDNLDIIANCTISNNILRNAGEGICRSAPDGAGTREAAIKGWDSKNQAMNFVIENNIFDRSASHLIDIGSFVWDVEKQTLTTATPEYLPIMRNNTYIQQKGKQLVSWNNKTINAETDAHPNLSVRHGCENSAKIYIVD